MGLERIGKHLQQRDFFGEFGDATGLLMASSYRGMRLKKQVG